MHRRTLLVCNALAGLLLSSPSTFAAWSDDPTMNLPVCTAAHSQDNPRIVPDGVGGAIVTWTDYRNGINGDIYAQHVLTGGTVDPTWPADGRAICTASGDQRDPAIISD